MFKKLKNVFLIGEVDKYNASLLIKNSVATLAPYKNTPNFQNSIPNKVIESLENGIPFITGTKGELKNLIKDYNNGIFFNQDIKVFHELIRITNDENYQRVLRINAKKSYQILFDFKKTYQKIIVNLCQI